MTVGPLDERDLVTRIQDGDDRATEIFDGWLRPRLLTFARCRGLAPQDAADVVQDTIVAAIAQICEGRYDGRGTLAGWVGSIFFRRTKDWHRARYRERRVLVPVEDGEGARDVATQPSTPAADTNLLVRQALLNLPPRERLVLLLNAQAGLPAHQIASILGLRSKATEAILTRAKKKFRETVAGAQEKPVPRRLTKGEPL